MKSLSIVTLALAIIAFSVSFVAGYLQIYNSSRISEIKKEQQKMADDLLKLQQQFSEPWKMEKGHAGNKPGDDLSGKEWPKYHEASAILKSKTENRIVVDQEEMPDFMRAMIMSYTVENPDQLKNIDKDDKVFLKLKETDSDLTVVDIKKLED